MTKKGYEKFASMINDRISSYIEDDIGTADDGAIQEIITIANKIANILSKDNPRFSREKFLIACGVISGYK